MNAAALEVDVGATCNLRYTLSPRKFEAGLREVLAEEPDWIAFQEVGHDRDPILERVCRELGYTWARTKGGDPVAWKIARHGKVPISVKPIRLARREYVGHIPGRRDRLPANYATEVVLPDLAGGPDVVVLGYHLTAEIQDVRGGGGYKKDPLHLLRVLRHMREKARLGRRARLQKRRGREVHPAGDGNFAGMKLRGFVSCWKDRKGGDLSGRAVSIIFGATRGRWLHTVKTLSDHLTVLVAYPGGATDREDPHV